MTVYGAPIGYNRLQLMQANMATAPAAGVSRVYWRAWLDLAKLKEAD